MSSRIIQRLAKIFRSKTNEQTDIDAHQSQKSEMGSVLGRISKQGFNPGTVIDIGVGNGTPELYSSFPDASLFLIDPLIEFEHVMHSITSGRDGDYIIAAAGSSATVRSINVHEEHPEGSSFFKETTPSISDGKPRDISIITIDDVVTQKKLKGPFLIKVDAQGFELEIMRGSESVLPITEVVVLEVLLYKFLSENPIFHDVVSFMHTKGFVCYDIFGLSYRPKDNALAHLDIVFVKENGIIRHDNDWK